MAFGEFFFCFRVYGGGSPKKMASDGKNGSKLHQSGLSCVANKHQELNQLTHIRYRPRMFEIETNVKVDK